MNIARIVATAVVLMVVSASVAMVIYVSWICTGSHVC